MLYDKIIYGVQDLSSQMPAMSSFDSPLTCSTASNFELQTLEKRSAQQQTSSHPSPQDLGISSSMLHHFIELEIRKVNISLLTYVQHISLIQLSSVCIIESGQGNKYRAVATGRKTNNCQNQENGLYEASPRLRDKA